MRRIAIALSLLAISCADVDRVATPPQEGLLTSDLTFVRFTPSAYAAAEKSASFWAVKGQTRSVSLRYADTNGEFMSFTVPANALAKRPDGSAIEAADAATS